tara:strand:- start:157 stop:354 length:198 start_codon:yes stop_codon:yes gene_type:complete
MPATDGWTLNRKIDDKVKELQEYIYFIGGKVYDLEEKVDLLTKDLEDQKKGKWFGKKGKDTKGNA